jgi:hypothetical protein
MILSNGGVGLPFTTPFVGLPNIAQAILWAITGYCVSKCTDLMSERFTRKYKLAVLTHTAAQGDVDIEGCGLGLCLSLGLLVLAKYDAYWLMASESLVSVITCATPNRRAKTQ